VRLAAALAAACLAGAALGQQDEYKFDVGKFEKKPYELGGYLEAKGERLWLDPGAALYPLQFQGVSGPTDDAGSAVAELAGTLRRDALRALAGRILPDYDDEALDRLTRRVLADSAGLPLLAVELLHAVALGLDLRGEEGTWPAPLRTLDQTMPGDLPDVVVGAIRAGFRRLTGEAQRVLAAAAVHGGRVPAAVLGRMTGLSGGPLAAALDELEWQRWLVADPRGYDFVARIVQVVIERDMVTPGQRERLRQAIAAT